MDGWELTYYNDYISVLTESGGRQYNIKLMGRKIQRIIGGSRVVFDNGESEPLYWVIRDFVKYIENEILLKEMDIKGRKRGIVFKERQLVINDDVCMKKICDVGEYQLSVCEDFYVVHCDGKKYTGYVYQTPYASATKIRNIEIWRLSEDCLDMTYSTNGICYRLSLCSDEELRNSIEENYVAIARIEDEILQLADALTSHSGVAVLE